MKQHTNLLKLKTAGLLLLLLYCGAFGAPGQSRAPIEQLWGETYGDEDRLTKLDNVAAAADGGFLLVGSTESSFTSFNSTPEPPQGLQAVRIGADGRLIWAQSFTRPNAYSAGPALATPEGGFLVSGNVHSIRTDATKSARGDNDFWAARLDAQGNKLWAKAFGGSGTDVLHSVVATEDGGFLLAGTSCSDKGFDKSEACRGGNDKPDFWVVRIDAEGKMLWDKTYGGDGREELKAVVPASGGFLLAGNSEFSAGFEKSTTFRHLGHDYWVVRIDANGAQLWDRSFGGKQIDRLVSALAAPDGGFLLAGTSNSEAGFDKSEDRSGGNDYWVVRTDAKGNLLWDKTFGGPRNEKPAVLIAAPGAEDEYLFAGHATDARVIKTKERLQFSNTDFEAVKFRDLTASTPLYRVAPEKEAAPGRVVIEFRGSSYAAGSEFALVQGGKTLKSRSVDLVSSGLARCWFDFSESDTGVWSAAVLNDRARRDTLKRALTVEAFSPRAQFDDGPAQRAERWNEYRLALSDTNGAEWGAPVWLALPEQAAPYQLSFQVAGAQPLETAWQDFDVDWKAFRRRTATNKRSKQILKDAASVYMLPLYLPYLPPGKTVHIRLRAPARFEASDFEVRAWTRNLDANADFFWFTAGCIVTKHSMLLAAKKAAGQNRIPGIYDGISDDALNLKNWRTAAAHAARDARSAFRLKALDWQNQPQAVLMFQQEFYMDAFERTLARMGDTLDAAQIENFLSSSPTVANDAYTEFIYRHSKAMLSKSDWERIHAGRMLPLPVDHQYLIRFGNKTGARAQEAIVKTELDPAFFDLATFHFGAAGFGDALFAAETFADSMKAAIDLRPDAGRLVRATGKLHRAEKAAEWRFTAPERNAMQLTGDLQAGLFPSGASSHDAAGVVYFAVETRSKLPIEHEIWKYWILVYDYSPPLFAESPVYNERAWTD